MPTTTQSTTKAQRDAKSLAAKIAKLRANGSPYDGDNGICAMPGMPKTATKCRALLREHKLVQQAGGIAKSYDRTDAFRAEESARRKAAPKAPAPKKTTLKKTTLKKSAPKTPKAATK